MESQWVTFKLAEETFGFEIQYVKEMLRIPTVHALPQASEDALGVILLRSEVLPVFDLRIKFKMEPFQKRAEELTALLRGRRQDHENWLNELEASVKDRREFTLTTDPHKCKFGLWYDQYTTENVWLRRVLVGFDQPHKEIHGVGERVKKLQHEGKHEEAAALVSDTRSKVLARLIALFEEAENCVQENSKQSLIVVGSASCTIGIAVDDISSVVRCNDEEIQDPSSLPGYDAYSGLIGLLAEKNSNKFTILLDPAQLYPQLIAQQHAIA